MRKIPCLFFLWVWSFLRLCSAVLLLTPVLVIIVVAWKSEPWKPGGVKFDPFVCGRISGEVYKFSRLYFPFWPEYEGKSSFDPGFIYNKKGCDANLVSVFLSMTWPELEPADDSLVFRQGLEHEGLLVAVAPITAREGDLRRQLEFLLRKSPAETITLAEYDESSSLYRVEARDTIFENHKKLIYWQGELDDLAAVGYCSWRPKVPNYYSCRMTFVVFGDVLVKVIMRPDKLMRWLEVRRSVVDFLINSRR
ncbi:hypothetical protein CXB65_13920 [Pseudomonas monteilii]|uniref:Uncharacterized protein n=1 Tax=Pseudomonas monteilii TaxID=76759 RepID=A0A2N1IQY7_9PSED|nr:hypothetical protein CXB65_13920 [Pseudomonas monteilii]POF91754.1 hypothetical protein BGP83_03285 [Pseudomonas putida]